MPSSRMLRRVSLVRSDVSEEGAASIFRVEKARADKSVSSWLAKKYSVV
jgi:hypothetical protein